LLELVGASAHEKLEPRGGDGVRFPGINALRAVAALSVLTFHVATFVVALPPHTLVFSVVTNLNQGVGLFFVISGFVLWRPFAAALLAGRSVSVSSYVRNRVLRILPLYLLLVVTAIAFDKSARSVPAIARSLSFAWVYGPEAPFGLGVTWSIDDEVVYYALMPVLFVTCAFIATKVGSKLRGRFAWGMVAALVAISVTYQIVVLLLWPAAPLWSPIVWNPLGKFALFGCGMLLAHVRSTNNALMQMSATIRNGVIVFVVATGTGVYFIHHFPAVSDILVGVGSTGLLAAIVWSPAGSGIVRVLSIAPVVFLGELSFGIYMWHMSVIQLLGRLGMLPRNFALALIFIGVVTIALSTLTYLLVERPALSLKRFWASPQVACPG
jgi:peptidoglycan/LPS O-acetylase OafA/YrhL